MFYSCTHMATVSVKELKHGLSQTDSAFTGTVDFEGKFFW